MTAKRNTWQKDAVRHALSEATGFVSAQQLFHVLVSHGSSIGLATVYRALADLETSGEADSITAEGETLYRACTTEHHHHLICKECGVTVEIEAHEVESWADKIAKAHGFTETAHTIEIFGICENCRRA